MFHDPDKDLDVSVVICTRNRAQSLRETLRLLGQARTGELRVEIVVVDNDSEDETADLVKGCDTPFAIRYLREARRGKSYCLNTVLDSGGLGQIVAILDDDMSPCDDWFQAVARTCERHPECVFFGGRVPLDYPEERLPRWMRTGAARGIGLSIVDWGESDKPIAPGTWPSGNHFWVRARIFEEGLRFKHVWLTEPALILDLVELGHRGVWSGEAIAGHRIQPELLSLPVVRARAARLGRDLAHITQHHYKSNPLAERRRSHPIQWGLRCAAGLVRNIGTYLSSLAAFSDSLRVSRQLRGILGMSRHFENLRILLASIGPERDSGSQ